MKSMEKRIAELEGKLGIGQHVRKTFHAIKRGPRPVDLDTRPSTVYESRHLGRVRIFKPVSCELKV